MLCCSDLYRARYSPSSSVPPSASGTSWSIYARSSRWFCQPGLKHTSKTQLSAPCRPRIVSGWLARIPKPLLRLLGLHVLQHLGFSADPLLSFSFPSLLLLQLNWKHRSPFLLTGCATAPLMLTAAAAESRGSFTVERKRQEHNELEELKIKESEW